MSGQPARLLFLVSTLGFGGAEKHVVTLANCLDRSQFLCSLAYLKPQAPLVAQLDTAGLQTVVCLNVNSRMDFRALRKLTVLVDEQSIDVIVCVNEYPTVYAWLAARQARRRPKMVEIFHTTEFGTAKAELQMVLYRQIIRRFDLLVYVSRNQQTYWRGRGLRARAEVVIHNGIDGSYFTDQYSRAQKRALRDQYGFGGADFVIGICASLRREKAHGDLLQAIAMLRARNINARCLIIGDGPERGRIEQMCSKLGLDAAVAIAGFQQDVRPLVASCDVMALVSHAVETFSIAALESMALGKPMVQSRIGGADEQIIDDQNGFLYKVGDIHALARALTKLSDPARQARMGQSAREYVLRHFTQSAMIARYSETLRAAAFGA